MTSRLHADDVFVFFNIWEEKSTIRLLQNNNLNAWIEKSEKYYTGRKGDER